LQQLPNNPEGVTFQQNQLKNTIIPSGFSITSPAQLYNLAIPLGLKTIHFNLLCLNAEGVSGL